MARVTKINVGGTNYDIAHEGELKNSGFEVVTALPTTGLFAGREVFHNRTLKPYIWNGHDWITNYRTYQIVSMAGISQQGWYDIGYYTDTTTPGSHSFLATEFHGTLRIITGYNLDRPLSLVLSISGGFTQLCMTQLSSCIGNGIIPKIRVVYNSELKRRILQFYYSANRLNSISIDYTDNSYYTPIFFIPLYAKSDVNYEGDAIIKEFTLTDGVKTNYNVEGNRIIKIGGTATQMLMADGSTKDISEFATVATSGSYNDLTDTPNLATVATSGSYNDLTDKPKLYEAKLLWGGSNIVGGYSPVDAGMMSELSANVMAFPNPNGISIEYSRDGGVTWLDYEATDEQKVNVFTTNTSIRCGKSDSDGLTATVGFQLRITITPKDCGLYTYLNKIIMKISTDGGNNCWATFKGLKAREVAAGNEDDAYYDTFVNKATISGWPEYNVINFYDIHTASYTTVQSQANHYYRLRLIFGYDSTLDSTPYGGLSIKQLKFFGKGRYMLPSNLATNNHLYTYDWQQNAYFPAKVESKELINFDVNNIEPTQTGSSVSKTSTWLWQYLVQAVNWLKANNVRLSAYNTKVAALEQADSDNNASIQSVSTDLTELSNGLATVATSGSYNDLIDKPTFSGSYNDLTDKPTIPNSFTDLSGSIAEGQIPDGLIANAKLANSSMTLNDTTVNLGDTAILPWYVDYNEVDYLARIRDHWLQIYRNGVWANLVYLGDILPTQVGQITSFDSLDWYNEQVSEYEVDSNTTTSILNGTTLPATVLMNCLAERLTINLYPISGKQYGKGSLDSLITDLQGKGFSVFVENDLDAIIGSGSDYLVRIKISKVPTAKAIIECYVAR